MADATPGVITVDELKDALNVKRGAPTTDQDERLKAAVDAAVDELGKELGYSLSLATRVDTLNGNGLRAMQLSARPVLSSPLPVVTEDGNALSVAFGYSATADVVIDPTTGWIYRQPGGGSGTVRQDTTVPLSWSRGVQNVVVTYSGGYTDQTAPPRLKRLVLYLASLYFKHLDTNQHGVERRSDGQRSTDFLMDLPAGYQRIIDAMRDPLKLPG